MGFIESVINTSLIHKIKYYFNIKRNDLFLVFSIIISFVFGTFFAVCFSELNYISCIWSSIFSFLGSHTLCSLLEGNLFNIVKEEKKIE